MSVEYSWQDSTKSKYYGARLDSTDLTTFSSVFLQETIYPYFACYKIPLAEHKIGLITRAPSEYSSTKLYFYVYDSEMDSIISTVELGDEWGDAGDYYKMNSWLVNLPKGLRIFTETYFSSMNFEADSTGNTEETIRSNFLLTYTGSSFDTLVKGDKISYRAFKKSTGKN